jgi:hypothetical protein
MRRTSDSRQGIRTGTGRRARDRLLTGEGLPAARGHAASPAVLLADDLREAALGLAGLETFVVRARMLLAEPAPSPEALEALANDRDAAGYLELLGDALASLRGGLRVLATR